MPKLSIGMPIYNGQNFMREAIDSILAQSFRDFELIITDNASTDATEEICREYCAADSRIRYVRNDRNAGAAENYNLCFALAKGEYFKWAAHDDVLHPEFLSACIDALDRDRSVVLCFSRIGGIGEIIANYDYDNGMSFDASQVHRRFKTAMDVRHWCISVFGVIRADELKKTSLIGSYVGSDRCLLTELALLGRMHRIPEVLFFHRFHSNASTVASKDFRRQMEWFDTRKKVKVCLPYWRYSREYFSIARKAQIRPIERALCFLHILSWHRKWAGCLYRDLRVALRHLLLRTKMGRRMDPWLFLDVPETLRSWLRRTNTGQRLEKWIFPDIKKIGRDFLIRHKFGRDMLLFRRKLIRKAY
jgi:glycosyltransferase involved in cell wall biosynthesis